MNEKIEETLQRIVEKIAEVLKGEVNYERYVSDIISNAYQITWSGDVMGQRYCIKQLISDFEMESMGYLEILEQTTVNDFVRMHQSFFEKTTK